jgi:hypothetical protein
VPVPTPEEQQPLTTSVDSVEGAMQAAKTSMIMGALGKLKENAANTFKEVCRQAAICRQRRS